MVSMLGLRSAVISTILANASSGQSSHAKAWATMIASTFLERKMTSEKDRWELIVDEAKGWLQGGNGVEVAYEMEMNPLKALLSEFGFVMNGSL